ncbi:MAG: serine/threonine protein kinase [Labilithrix sp.]|nr:serine/threonine protein kinase [Labilithrix sp.]
MTSQSATGERILERYTLHAAIASGVVGTVHLGRDEVASGIVAIKRLHPQLAVDETFVARFFDETRLAAHVHHPNVVRTIDIAREAGEVFVVMEYVPGESLIRLIRSKRPSYRVIVTIMRDVLMGLHAAHEATDASGVPLHVVHRDVGPNNVLVGEDGVARVLDFGRARPAHAKGRLAYLAPEHLSGGVVSRQTDVYAVGVMLWEIVTGKRLFKGERDDVVVSSILDGAVPALMNVIMATAARDLPDDALGALEALDSVVMRAVAAAPTERYATAREMAEDLELALEPRSPRRIASWVRKAAGEVLSSRARIVETLERVEEPAEPEPLAHEAPLGPPLLLPIVVADLADASALTVLDSVANAGGMVLVPLLTAPADGGEHLLEAHVPDREAPALFFARAMGPPTEAGFPLSLRPYGAAPKRLSPASLPALVTGVSGRSALRLELTESHSRDLTHSGPGELVEQHVIGRALQGGKLVIEERIGGGGGGAVYRARWTEDKRRDVAVKVQHDRAQKDLEFCARFHAEALAASKLDHKNLVRVIDFGQEPDGLLHLTMEHLEGPSLRRILEAEGPLPMERAVELMRQICAGLAHAHERGVVHRDVKPSNVILVTQRDDDGNTVQVAKLCDFGIAVAPAEGGDLPRRASGTAQYMSPEQCRGEEVDARGDVYACGVTLYELVTGELPFQGRDRAELMRLHQLAAPTPPSTHLPDIDPLLERIILRALAKTPSARQQTMLELRTALGELLEPAFVPDRRSSFGPVRAPAVEEAEETSAGPAVEALVALMQQPADTADLERATARVERVVKMLASRGDAAALGEVIRVVVAAYEEAGRREPAATCARRVLHTAADPVALVPSAEKLLSASAEPTEAELSLIVWAKVAGAHALYGARMRHEGQAARTRFVSAMRLVGSSAVPVLYGALEQLWPADGASIEHPTVVVDLLRSVPGARDEALGTVISRYARRPEPEIQNAAFATIAHVWGERAIPALLAGIQSPDDRVQITALRSLKTVGGVDEVVVRKIGALLAGGAPISEEMRIVAAEALGYAATDARTLAARVVLRFVAEGATGAKNAVVLAFARAALALAPAEAKNAIAARAARSDDLLRGALLALL